MVTVIPHPERFKTGTRLLQRTARSKDKAFRRPDTIRVSYDALEYDGTLHTLLDDIRAGERIYASLDARDMSAARRKFNSDLADVNFSESEEHRIAFYRNLNSRWNSALGAKASAKTRLFLFDVDSADPEHRERLYSVLGRVATYTKNALDCYEYPTKNGFHVITDPFNPNLLSDDVRPLLHTNALMLVAYWK